jgi:glutathione S-transferase
MIISQLTQHTDPNAYASEERIAAAATPSDKQALYLFNCAQRAHYNFLENYVAAAPAALIAGLAYPRASAITFGIWNVFRIVYALGYTDKTRSDGKGRLAGSGFWIAEAVLFGMVGKMGYDLVLA